MWKKNIINNVKLSFYCLSIGIIYYKSIVQAARDVLQSDIFADRHISVTNIITIEHKLLRMKFVWYKNSCATNFNNSHPIWIKYLY